MKFDSVSGINVKQLKVNDHAIKRVKERIPEWANMKKEQIIGNIRAVLKRAEYITDTIDSRGNPASLFIVDKKAFHISPDWTVVYTVVIYEDIKYEPLRKKYVDLHKLELRKLTRKEQARLKYLKKLKMECNVEIASLKLRMFKTKSKRVKDTCTIRLKAIEQSFSEYELEIKDIQSEKTKIAKALVAII
jgi:hypothetical protein